ncbi:SDR family NAD(P)-dependent oxidoreductase [Pseudactinotalea sp. Z1748]|uniref:SDR family NAD(P)-dependent oxidoreductase n=1 Tax=Pseudactinotalea sp. Z1748 TaxID=3413027 RepID=UPI003C7BAD47
MFDQGKIAVVTGATGGIGSALVAELLGRDFSVVAIGRNLEKFAEVESHRQLRVVQWDQGQDGEVPQELSSLTRVDVLVHNAGIAPIRTVADTTTTGLAHIMSVNLISAAALTAALLGALRAVRGHVVFVSSSPGLRGVPGWSGYMGSKSALKDLADSLRHEERNSGVKVTTVFPGAVATDLLRQVREGRGGQYHPDQCVSAFSAAKLIAMALDHPEDGYLTDVSFTKP